MNKKDRNDQERFREVLEKLDIVVSESPDGNLTVYTVSEPLFCFVRRTQDEIAEVVQDTLRSYAEVFYPNLQIDVRVDVNPIAERQIPVERLSPIQRILPSFSSRGGSASGLIPAG